jgi:hypothetical protein
MDTFEFEGLNRCQSVCGVEIQGNVVVVTQLPENQGTSVTNAWPVLADLIMLHYGLIEPALRGELRWIEHYPSQRYLGQHVKTKETWDEIFMVLTKDNTHQMHPDKHPWRRLTEEEVKNLINQ